MSVALRLTRGMPVIVQSANLASCSRWIDAMRRYGTNVAGCVSPGATSDSLDGLPLFKHCGDAVAATRAAACVSIMPPRTAADAVLEAADAGIQLIVWLGTGIPIHDTMRAHRRIDDLGVTWIGAASSGIACPATGVMLGAIPAESLASGHIALVSTAGDLSAEAGLRMREAGLGQSLYIDVGSDMVKGTRLAALAEALKADEATRAVALLGTTFGSEEEEFALTIQRVRLGKPVLAYIAGRSLPDVAGPIGTLPGSQAALRKEAALAVAGATVYNSLGALVAALRAFA